MSSIGDYQAFYNDYKDSSVFSTLGLLNESRSFVSLIGIFVNLLLVYVTTKTKNMRDNFHLLIAIDSLGSAIHLFGQQITLAITLSGINFISLSSCFSFQAIPLFAVNMAYPTLIMVALERLIVIIFPIWTMKQTKKQKRRQLILMLIPCFLFASFATFVCYLVTQENQQIGELKVLCTVGDLYQDWVGKLLFRCNVAIASLVALIYLAVIFSFWRAERNVKGKKENGFNRRIFKSLSIIMGIVLVGWLANYSIRLCIPLMQFRAGGAVLFNGWMTILTGLTLMCNGPVLFTFSKEYRSAFANCFKCINSPMILFKQGNPTPIQSHLFMKTVPPTMTRHP